MTVKELRIKLEELEEQGKKDEKVLLDIGDGYTRPLEYFWLSNDGSVVLD